MACAIWASAFEERVPRDPVFSDTVVLDQVYTAYPAHHLRTILPESYGNSIGFDAVVGETSSEAHAGVTGRNLTTGGAGVLWCWRTICRQV